MKLIIVGARAEGKSRLLEVIKRRVLEDYGSECHINDGGVLDFIQGGHPLIHVLVTNDLVEADNFLDTEEE